ncbi:uncharacterized protein [Cicer arietinum]|uniref:uncharacterized protein n=1 Tax=Cicer arietinum TaxID=3827 RepID=UPI003CC60AD9
MVGVKDDSLQAISAHLNGQNYSYWIYVMQKILIGKYMLSYVDGTYVKRTDKNDEAKYTKDLKKWNVSNSKIITWISNSFVLLIDVQLAKYDIAKEIWDHLKCLYVQSKFAKRYQLANDIKALKQNNKIIQEFYSAMTNLWDQLTLMESTKLKAVKTYTNQREEQRSVWFLMALRDDFEGHPGGVLHRSPLPTVEIREFS